MKLTNDQWSRIIQALVTFIVTVCNVVLVSSCAVTMSMSIQKNNSSSNQQSLVMILLLWIYLLISSFMISTIKIYRQCYYCWNSQGRETGSFKVIRSRRPSFDVFK